MFEYTNLCESCVSCKNCINSYHFHLTILLAAEPLFFFMISLRIPIYESLRYRHFLDAASGVRIPTIKVNNTLFQKKINYDLKISYIAK